LFLKNLFTILLSLGLIISISFGLSSTTEAAKPVVKTYKNCTELNKDYKGGVAQKAGVKNIGGKTKYTPFVSKELYEANKKSDRDKDLIACEK
jgi:hypothetical protein